ncbi:MAG: hypothetical protein ABL952_06705, partial [Pyrinomonadaceae bacterium]
IMGFLGSLFGKKPKAQSEEQAVLIYMKLSNDEFGATGETAEYYLFEDDLEAILANQGVGELDGHEFGGGVCSFLSVWARRQGAVFIS